MSEEQKQKYEENLKWLHKQIETLDNNLDMICVRQSNGAVLSYPEEFQDTELNTLHRECVSKIDKVLKQISEIQKSLSEIN